MGNGDVYVGFPCMFTDVEPLPKEVTSWVEETIVDPYWLIHASKRHGIYLSPADAVAFKLKFG